MTINRGIRGSNENQNNHLFNADDFFENTFEGRVIGFRNILSTQEAIGTGPARHLGVRLP